MTCLIQAVLSNWGQEFVKWAPDIAVVMYDGSPDERKQLQRDRVEKGTFNVLVTHYDLVMRDKAALRKVPFFFVTLPCLCTAYTYMAQTYHTDPSSVATYKTLSALCCCCSSMGRCISLSVLCGQVFDFFSGSGSISISLSSCLHATCEAPPSSHPAEQSSALRNYSSSFHQSTSSHSSSSSI